VETRFWLLGGIIYGARARAGGTCLVAVLHAAGVIGCRGCATGAASVSVIVSYCMLVAVSVSCGSPPWSVSLGYPNSEMVGYGGICWDI